MPTSTSRRCTRSGSRCSACPTSCAARRSARPRCRASSREVLPHIAAGRIKPQIDRVFDFAQLRGSQGAHGSRRPCRQDRAAHAGRGLIRRTTKETSTMRRHEPRPGAGARRASRAPPGAQPADYPSKPIRLVIGFAPGGAADYVARAMSEAFGKALGPAGGGRQQAGQRLEHRRGPRGQVAARRLHAADRQPEQHLGEPGAQSEAAVHADATCCRSPR